MMKREDWRRAIKQLPAGLTANDAAKHIGRGYSSVLFWLRHFGYRYRDGRGSAWNHRRKIKASKVKQPSKINWTLPNVKIARKYGISRERARQLRQIHSPL